MNFLIIDRKVKEVEAQWEMARFSREHNHILPSLPFSSTEEVIERINREKPDFVIVGSDLGVPLINGNCIVAGMMARPSSAYIILNGESADEFDKDIQDYADGSADRDPQKLFEIVLGLVRFG